MKSLSLFVSAAALLSASSVFALDCGTVPTCESLGYNDTVSHCPKSSDGKDMVVKCPFDTTKGKCIFEAAVGEIAYFPKAPNANSGWLLCDGTSKSRTQYPQLADWLDTTFCNKSYHLSTSCPKDGGTFAVPNYQGYFLRVYGTPNTAIGKVGNFDLTTPQKEGLPNIYGQLGPFDDSLAVSTPIASGPFSVAQGYDIDLDSSGSGAPNNKGTRGSRLTFNATTANPIYGSSTGVTPPNIAVYAYIYAGKVVK